jgi:hypothetical protein
MLITFIAWAMVIVFMTLILTKKMHPFTAIVLIPLLFSILGAFAGLYQAGAAKALKLPLDQVGTWEQIQVLGIWIKQGLTRTSGTAFMLFFAILFFCLMLNVGLFDPLTKRIVVAARADLSHAQPADGVHLSVAQHHRVGHGGMAEGLLRMDARHIRDLRCRSADLRRGSAVQVGVAGEPTRRRERGRRGGRRIKRAVAASAMSKTPPRGLRGGCAR